MNCRPRAWAWGLIPLAFVVTAALVMRVPTISAELSERTAAALENHEWAAFELAGRDVILAGTAPDDAVAEAHRALVGLSGLRRVSDVTTSPPVATIYKWWIERDAERVILGGHVPSASLRSALRGAAGAAFPELGVEDEMSYATGVPEDADWSAAAQLMIEVMARLESGRAELEDRDLKVSGRAAKVADYEAVPGMVDPPPDGFRLAAYDVEPAFVTPHRFEARINGDRVELSGHVPSRDAAEFARGEMERMSPDWHVSGDLSVAEGKADDGDWITAARHALGRLALLGDGGRIAIVDEEIHIEGRAADRAAYDALLAGSGLQPPGFAVTSAIQPPGGRRR